MGAIRKALRWAAFSLGVTLVPMYLLSRWTGLEVPPVYWAFATFCSGGISFLVSLRLAWQGEQLRRLNEKLEAAHAQLKRVAETDPLTGVLNRSAFLDQLEPEHRRVGGWILVLDVDHFKSINDRFGHEVGDRALRKVAGVLRRSARTGDLIGRLGGEEFGIYLPGVGRGIAMQVAERMRCDMETASLIDPVAPGMTITVSIGLAAADRDVAIAESLRRADFAMYGAKRDGRNRVRVTA